MTELQKKIHAAMQEAQISSGQIEFDAMSWLDYELEDNPQFFDSFFDRSWNDLNEVERQKRLRTIREAL